MPVRGTASRTRRKGGQPEQRWGVVGEAVTLRRQADAGAVEPAVAVGVVIDGERPDAGRGQMDADPGRPRAGRRVTGRHRASRGGPGSGVGIVGIEGDRDQPLRRGRTPSTSTKTWRSAGRCNRPAPQPGRRRLGRLRQGRAARLRPAPASRRRARGRARPDCPTARASDCATAASVWARARSASSTIWNGSRPAW